MKKLYSAPSCVPTQPLKAQPSKPEADAPSERVLQNILSFSKALEVKKLPQFGGVVTVLN